MRLRRGVLCSIAWLSLCLCAATAHAQEWPTCKNALGVSVVRVYGGELTSSTVAAITRNGDPIILYDPSKEPPTDAGRLFVYEHECGHHAMGDLLTHRPQGWDVEEEADCYSIVVLTSLHLITNRDVSYIGQELRKMVRTDDAHPPGEERARNLAACRHDYESYVATFEIPHVLHPEGDTVFVHDKDGVHLATVPCMHTYTMTESVTMIRPRVDLVRLIGQPKRLWVVTANEETQPKNLRAERIPDDQ